ncbi:hypothetical protein [Mesorhizobium sp. M0778]|uniref:hypothetical protein n=1 Tax=Mesorhizobium sp. M0778 TaxID=2956999 RepID=UPI003335843A
MKASKFSDAQKAFILKQGADGIPVAEDAVVGSRRSPSSGRAIRDVVVDGTCSFADISSFRLARVARLEPDWRELQGWAALAMKAA